MKIEASSVIVEDSPFNREVILKMLPRLNYEAIVAANKELSSNAPAAIELPETRPLDADDQFLAALHKVLFDIHLVEGYLVCPVSGRRFPVKDSIPNMILHEDEV